VDLIKVRFHRTTITTQQQTSSRETLNKEMKLET